MAKVEEAELHLKKTLVETDSDCGTTSFKWARVVRIAALSPQMHGSPSWIQKTLQY